MRILILNYEYPPLGGGAANATACLLREFAGDACLTVDLVTSSESRGRIENPADNITMHFLDIGKSGNLHYQTNKELLAYSWKAYRYARRLVAGQPYDVCHAFFGIPCGFIARKLGLPYIVSLRGSDVPFYNERFRHLDRLFFKRMSARIWRDARFVMANSAGLRQLALESVPAQPIGVICNGVDTEAFHPRDSEGAERAGLRVVCVSRLIERKGIDFLIRAMGLLREENIRLTVAGRGNQEEALRDLARELGVADRIRFEGLVEHDRIGCLYRESDVFVLPSLNEGMSNTILEAMASGLPIVTTDTGGTAELVEDGRNGRIIAMRDAQDIATKLREYLERPEQVRMHGQISRQIAESMSWREVAEAYRQLYSRSAGAESLPEDGLKGMGRDEG